MLFLIRFPYYFWSNLICGIVTAVAGAFTLWKLGKGSRSLFGIVIAACIMGTGLAEIGWAFSTAIWGYGCSNYLALGNLKYRWIITALNWLFEFHYWLFGIKYLETGINFSRLKADNLD